MTRKGEFRKDSFSGFFTTSRGYVQVSEDYFGEGYNIETWDNTIGELQKVYLRSEEIFALAKIGVVSDIFDVPQLTSEIATVCEANEQREQELEEIRRVYSSYRRKLGFSEGG